MKKLILSLAFAFFAFNNPQADTSEFLCVLTSDKTEYSIGELPKFTVHIINNSNNAVMFIGSLDGSSVQWRYPYCYFTIHKPVPDTIPFMRCGNMNPLSVEDFVVVEPGQKFNPFEEINERRFFSDRSVLNPESFRNSGIYKIRFHYSTKSDDINKFFGGQIVIRELPKTTLPDGFVVHGGCDSACAKNYIKTMSDLLAKVPRIELESNEITITVQ